MDLLTQIPLGDIGPGALVTLAVVLLLRGDLVPRRTHEAVAQERDYWRDAYRENTRTTNELTEVSRASVAALDALPTPPDKGGGT